MQRPATSLLETIIREEIILLKENNHEYFANDYSDERDLNKKPANAAPKPYTGDLKKYVGKTLPKPTAGDIQKFLSISVDGDFGDDSAKATADFIYGKNTSHGIQTVSDLYDRMQDDGWAVGAKTGSIFANNGTMANAIIELMRERTKYTGMTPSFPLSIRYLNHPAYSKHPDIDQTRFGLDYGGRNKYSTTARRDFIKKFNDSGINPYAPKGLNTLMTQEQASTIFGKWMTKSYIGVKTPRNLSVPGVIDSNCGGLENLVNSLQNITLNELAALFQVNKGQGNPNNLFNYIISYGNKYYPSVKGKGKIRTSSCNMYPETKWEIGLEFVAVEKHIRGLIDTGAAFYEELRNIGDVWIDLKTSIEISLSYLGQYLDIPGHGDGGNYHLAVKRSDLEGFGKYGIGAYGGVQMGTYNLVKEYPHEMALVLSIGTSFLGPIGLLISSGIMVGDAALYYKEGNYNMAGVSALFAVLPFLKVPGLKQWTAAQWGKFAQRVSANTYKTLAATDKVVLTQLAKRSQTIKLAVQRFTDSAAKGAATKYTRAEMKSDPIKFITRKIANGTLKSTKLTAYVIKESIPYLTAIEAWEFIYETYGLDEKSLKSMDNYNLNKALSALEKSEMN